MQTFLSHINLLNFFMYINVFLVLFVIFLEHKDATATWSWIMVMLFIPIFGFILYFFLGQDLRKRKTFNKKEEEDSFYALLHTQKANLSSHLATYSNPLLLAYKDLITLHLNAHEALYTEDNNLNLFTDGHALFKSLLTTLKNAKHSIHMEYYIFRDDRLGQIFKTLLIQKAKEGVQIYIVYDDMGCFGNKRSFF